MLIAKTMYMKDKTRQIYIYLSTCERVYVCECVIGGIRLTALATMIQDLKDQKWRRLSLKQEIATILADDDNSWSTTIALPLLNTRLYSRKDMSDCRDGDLGDELYLLYCQRR